MKIKVLNGGMCFLKIDSLVKKSDPESRGLAYLHRCRFLPDSQYTTCITKKSFGISSGLTGRSGMYIDSAVFVVKQNEQTIATAPVETVGAIEKFDSIKW